VHLEERCSCEAGEFTDFLHERGVAVEMEVQDGHRVGYSSDPFVHGAQLFRQFVGRSIERLFPLKDAGLSWGSRSATRRHSMPGSPGTSRPRGSVTSSSSPRERCDGARADLALASWLKLRRAARLALASGTVVFFILVTGAEPSVLRAA